MTKKWVYLFEEGNKDMRDLLGGKGAGLAEMTNAGLPVPPGFTITTEACNAYFDAGKQFPEGMWDQVLEAMKEVEKQTGKKFGDPSNPLLVSCRSGARVSMPGMMDTVLNIGLNADTLKGMVELTGNERFAWDAYRRLVQMFGNIVKGVDRHKFEAILDEYKGKTEGGKDTDVTTSSHDAQSTAMDMARLGQMLLNRGAYGSRRFFGEATLEKMLPRMLTKVLGPDTKTVWGIGCTWMNTDIFGERTFGHGSAASATLRIDLDNELVVSMTRNTAGKNFGTYHGRLLTLVAQSVVDEK